MVFTVESRSIAEVREEKQRVYSVRSFNRLFRGFLVQRIQILQGYIPSERKL